METFAVELLTFVAGAAVAALLWRRRRIVLIAAAMAAVVLLAVLVAQAVTGWQWHRAGTQATEVARIHHAIGHRVLPLVSFALPLLLAAALLRSRRRVVHVAAVLALAAAWWLAGVSGYIAPSPQAATAPALLRFVLIHMFGVPLLTGLLLLLMAWRHARAARRLPQERTTIGKRDFDDALGPKGGPIRKERDPLA